MALRHHDTEDNSLARHLYSDEPGDTDNLKGRTSTSLPARIEWNAALHRHEPTVSEVGLEDLTFEFPVTPYGGHFSELGYNPIAFSDVAHCWIRRIRIANPDSGPFIKADFCTITDPQGRWFEAIPPDLLHPRNLHEAQLARLLGR